MKCHNQLALWATISSLITSLKMNSIKMKELVQNRRQQTHINQYLKKNTPVVRTGVDPHMPIAITANSLQHWPSPTMRRPVFHKVRDGRASLSHRANDHQTCYQFLA